jgi:hypothetical protein
MALRSPDRLYLDRGNRLQTAPTTEPVTADELRNYLSIDSVMLSDTEANSQIEFARQFIEDKTGLAMITQTWLVVLDRWPTGQEPWWDGVRQMSISELSGPHRSYELPRYPLISVDGVNVYDEAGNATAVTIANVFDIDTYRIPGRMTLKNGSTWPVALRDSNAIEITYKAGYGAAGDVPAPLRRAVIQFAGYLWDHRGECDIKEAYVRSGAMSMAGIYAEKRI